MPGRRAAIAAVARLALSRVAAREGRAGARRLPFPRDLEGLPGIEPKRVAAAEAMARPRVEAALEVLDAEPSRLGAILSDLAPLEESKAHGIVYTPPPLAALMVRLALEALAEPPGPELRALDPAAGSGAFLVALARALPQAQVLGIERDASAAHLARLRLLAEDVLAGRAFAPVERRIVTGDALGSSLVGPALALPVDLVVANPPYVRHESLDREVKRDLHDRLGAVGSVALSRRSDLFVYFLARLRDLLRKGGAAAVVTPNSWLHTAYGRPLRRFLLQEFEIRAILETAAERWFGDAAVHGLVVVLKRKQSTRGRSLPVRFAYRTRALSSESDAEEAIEPPAYRVRSALPADLARREERDGAPWTLELRAPPIFLEVLDRARHRLVPLGDVSSVRFGGKTGANAFFYVRAESAPDGPREEWIVRPIGGASRGTLRVPGECLEPALLSPRELERHIVRLEDLDLRLLRFPEDPSAFLGTDLERHVRDAEASGVHERPSVRGRNPWYRLPASPVAPLLHSLIVDERPGAFLVETPCWVDANLDTITPSSPATALGLLACLSSSFGLLAREFYLPSNLGEGALKANPAYLSRVPVLDARRVPKAAWARLERSGRAFAEMDPRRASQAELRAARLALDAAFVDATGLEAGARAVLARWAVELRAALAAAVSARKRRSRGPREAADGVGCGANRVRPARVASPARDRRDSSRGRRA